MTPDEARALVESIRDGLGDLAARIRAAYDGRAWIALGYDSWALMCQQEFGGTVNLPSGKRRVVVKELAAAGMSNRAIGQALGEGKSTISDDRQVSGSRTPDAKVIGLDGKRYTPPAPKPKKIVDPAPSPPPDPGARGRTRAHELVQALYQFTDLDPAEIGHAPLSTRQQIRDQCRAVLHLLTKDDR